jgi:hypothetical protein
VFSVPGYRCRDPGSILGATRFFSLRNIGSGTGSTQPRDDKRGAISRKYLLRSRKPKSTAVGIRCTDHATPSIRKLLVLTSQTSGGRSAGIVRLRAKTTEFVCFVLYFDLSMRAYFLVLNQQINVFNCRKAIVESTLTA